MNEHEGDLWEMEGVDVRCILTNGTVLPNGKNIMGGGVAGEAARRYPWLPKFYGQLLMDHGCYVMLVPPRLLMFPTKARIEEKAALDLIECSIQETKRLADIYEWSRIALPRPGAGLGGLVWEEIRDDIAGMVDERFILVHKEFVPYARFGAGPLDGRVEE